MNKLILLFCSMLILACNIHPRESYQDKAKELISNKKYQEAIDEYWNHINRRLAVKDRPDWENPYIYLLDIGDVYVEMGNIDEATKNYELAEKKKVKQAYVNDRYRYIANWYEKQGDLEKALEQLKKYQSKDPDLFNLMMDRIAKEIVEKDK